MKRFLSLAFILLLLVGCSSMSHYKVVYPNQPDVQGRHLLFLPVSEDFIRIENKDDVEDDFSEDKREPELVLRDSLYTTIIKTAPKLLKKSIVVEKMNPTEIFTLQTKSNLFSFKYKVSEADTAHTFFIPNKDWLIAHGKVPDIIALITDISFGRNSSSSNSPGHISSGSTVSTPGGSFNVGGGVMTGGGSLPSLDARFGFIIYDYKKDTCIVYGSSVAGSKIAFGMTISNWNSTFREVAEKMFSKTPSFLK